jgi:hypothetical protein
MNQTHPYGATNTPQTRTPEAGASQRGQSRGRSVQNMPGRVISHAGF